MKFNHSFPFGIPTEWHCAESMRIPDPCLKNWLLDTRSLTERLKSQCRKFELQLLGQRQMSPELEEINSLGGELNARDSQWQVREVLLKGDGEPWVFARSILPDQLCHEDLAELVHQPLGQLLFNDARFCRSPFELTRVESGNNFLHPLDVTSNDLLWGRRSVFTFKHYKMMVAEIFLPSSPAYKQMSGVRD